MRPARMQLGGKQIEAGWWGPEPQAAPTLVLLHEGLGCVELWRGFPAELAQATGCGVVAWSRLGYGRSDPAELPWPVSYMHTEALHRVGPLLDAARIDRCILVGHSDGASIAAIYAGSVRDERVRGLVLISPHYFVEPMCLASIEQAQLAYEQGDLRDRLARYHDHVDIAFGGWNGAWLNPQFRAWKIVGSLAQIGVPMLQIQGTHDPYGSEAQPRMAEQHARCVVETVMVPGARHAPHLEAAAPVLQSVAGFTERVFAVHQARAATG